MRCRRGSWDRRPRGMAVVLCRRNPGAPMLTSSIGTSMSTRNTVRTAVANFVLACAAVAVVTSPPPSRADAALPGHLRAGTVLRDLQIAGVDGVPGDAVAVFAD